MNKKLAYLFGCQVGESPQYWCLFFNKWQREAPSTEKNLSSISIIWHWATANGGKMLLRAAFKHFSVTTNSNCSFNRHLKKRKDDLTNIYICYVSRWLNSFLIKGSSLLRHSNCRWNKYFNFLKSVQRSCAQLCVGLHSTSIPCLMSHILRQCPTFWLARVKSLKSRTESVMYSLVSRPNLRIKKLLSFVAHRLLAISYKYSSARYTFDVTHYSSNSGKSASRISLKWYKGCFFRGFYHLCSS